MDEVAGEMWKRLILVCFQNILIRKKDGLFWSRVEVEGGRIDSFFIKSK